MTESDASSRIALLLVDDDTAVRQALTRALDRSGAFGVIPAAHGRQALDILDRQPIDAILTDLQMPVMDGLTLIGRLLERDVPPPVAIMTGHSVDARLRERLGQAGIAAIFTKPVDVISLADELQRLLAPRTVDRLTRVTLPGLLHLLEIEHRSGLVVVHPFHGSGVNGRFFFEEGALIHAETPGLKGLPAAREMLGWAEATVEIFHDRVTQERTIEMSLQHVLLEVARLEDEEPQKAAKRVAVPGAGKRLASKAPERPELHWAVLEALEIPAAVGAALLDAGAGPVRAVAVRARGGETDQELAGVAERMVDAQLAVLVALGRPDALQDVLITTAARYYLLQPLDHALREFLFLALDRPAASVELARVRLSSIAKRAHGGRSG